tara:strand:- start:217 stop:450 length:234 start_codon:yes stop_codon:yes gene_type:complete
MANLKTIKEEKKKKGGQGNKGRTSKKKSTPKKDTKLAKLREVAPGIAGNDSTLKLLKRLGINPKDLTDGNYSWTKKS